MTFNIKKALLFVLAIFIVVAALFSCTKAEQLKEEVIIVYRNDIGAAAIHDLTNEITHHFSSIPALTVALTEKEIATIRKNPHIKSVDRNVRFTIVDQTIKALPETQIYLNANLVEIKNSQYQWNIVEVNAKSAWDEGFTGENIKVAVIDTGIAPHPDLEIVGGVSTVDYTDSWVDDNGHGTLVAGTIAAKHSDNGISGVAPGVKLYAVKALDENGDGTLQSVLDAIDWAIDHHMDIINLSLGTTVDVPSLHEMVTKANNREIIVVGASGNSGSPEGIESNVNYPAKYDSVIAIAAVNQNLRRSSFSSTGSEVEFSAPGDPIINTYLDGQYGVASGTSFAAPHVSGMLALLKQMHPQKTNVELRSKLKQHVVDLGKVGRDPWYGYGLVKYEELTSQITTPIARIGGSTLYETSALISQEGWEQSDVVVLARGDRFSDALTGVPLAAKYDAPLLLSRSNRLDNFTKNELLRLKAKRVIVLGGQLAIEKRVVDEIEQLGITVQRLAGSSMHATAELIAKEVAPNGTDLAIIVSDSRFQDALSVASYAGVRGIPILLANTTSLPRATNRALQDLGVKETLIIGGELAVSTHVESFLPNPERIAGRTMYHTNVQVFEYFQPNTNKVYVATAGRFQDGLSGGALAAKENVAVILVGDNLHRITRENIINANYKQARVLGGELAVNATVYSEIFHLMQ